MAYLPVWLPLCAGPPLVPVAALHPSETKRRKEGGPTEKTKKTKKITEERAEERQKTETNLERHFQAPSPSSQGDAPILAERERETPREQEEIPSASSVSSAESEDLFPPELLHLMESLQELASSGDSRGRGERDELEEESESDDSEIPEQISKKKEDEEDEDEQEEESADDESSPLSPARRFRSLRLPVAAYPSPTSTPPIFQTTLREEGKEDPLVAENRKRLEELDRKVQQQIKAMPTKGEQTEILGRNQTNQQEENEGVDEDSQESSAESNVSESSPLSPNKGGGRGKR